MPDSSTFALFLAATFVLNVTPGPDVFFVLANAGRHGFRGGAIASLGVSAGIVIHTCLAAFGVGALAASSPHLLDALRYAGALYLIYLGVQAWRAKPALPAEARRRPLVLVFRDGFVTNLLNPKVLLFFLAFLPQFIRPEAASAWLQGLVLGACFIVCGTAVNIGYAALAGFLARRVLSSPRGRLVLDRVCGSLLLALGLRLLWPRSSAP